MGCELLGPRAFKQMASISTNHTQWDRPLLRRTAQEETARRAHFISCRRKSSAEMGHIVAGEGAPCRT